EGGHASAGFAEDTRGTTAVKPWGSTHHGLWRHRTEGEIFWVIKHGSPGTAMIGFGTQLTDE
ncbi:MAG: hypothetical protein AABZ22_08925, partial [Nitrospirota bacterium]